MTPQDDAQRDGPQPDAAAAPGTGLTAAGSRRSSRTATRTSHPPGGRRYGSSSVAALDGTAAAGSATDSGPEDPEAEERLLHGGDEETVADTVGEDAEKLGPAPSGARRAGIVSAHNRKVIVLSLVGGLVFFFGPALGFVLGDRAEPIDNRPLVEMPSITEGWDFIPDFQAWANDYLPLRAQAVKLGTEISELVFREPPAYGNKSATAGAPGVPGVPAPDAGATDSGGDGANAAVNYPQVIAGKDGWLYLGSDASAPCQPDMPVPDAVAGLKRLSDAVTASGRTFVLAIPPDKSAAVPQFLPDTFAGKNCMTAARQEFWALLGQQGMNLVDIQGDLTAAEQTWGETIWRPSDTHWGPRGALTFADAIADAIDPAISPDAEVVSPGPVALPGDLSAMLGSPSDDTVKGVDFNRPGVTLTFNGEPLTNGVVPDLGYSVQTIDGTTDGAPLVPQRTLIIGDSFLAASLNATAPFFSSMSYIHNMTGDAPDGAPGVASGIVDADVVVYEVVERAAVSGQSSFQDPANIAVIEQALAANPR